MMRLVFCLGWSALCSTAFPQPPATIPRFGTFEVSVQNPRLYADPYRDVAVSARFRSAAGESIAVDGFHDGGQKWKARFRPAGVGAWTYDVAFSDGARGVSGRFTVEAGGRELPPIGIHSANPIWFGRGPEPFLMRALHVGDRFLAANWPDADRIAFLDWFQTQGYNTLSIASHYLNRNEPGRGQGWETPRLYPLDAAEYRRMERILDELRARDIVVFPFAGFIGKNSNYPREPDERERYIRYTMARIGHYPNLLYNVGGPEPNLRQGWFPSREVERLGRLIRQLDTYAHPLSVHNQTGPDPYRDSDWTTFGTLQGPKTLNRAQLAHGILENHHPAKPLFAQETLWSRNRFHMQKNGRDYSDADLRKHLFVLNMCAASVCFADNDGDSSSGFSGTLDLRERQQPRHDILKRVWDLFATLPYAEMKPRPDLVDAGYALAQPGRQYLVYLETRGIVNVSIEGGPFAIEWINAGDPADRRSGGTTSDGRQLATPADGDDWLLWLRRR